MSQSTFRYSLTCILATLCIFVSAGCSPHIRSTESISQNDTNSMVQDASGLLDQSQMHTRIKRLLDNNLKCIYMFSIVSLPLDSTIIDDKMQKVQSDDFRTFKDLKAFITDTYASRAANYLLYDFLGKGHPLYFEKDGVFYADAYGGGGGVELYNWSDYTFQYSDIDSNTKLVSITLMQGIDTPDGHNTGEIPVTIKVKIVLENGSWKLNDYIFYAQPDGTVSCP